MNTRLHLTLVGAVLALGCEINHTGTDHHHESDRRAPLPPVGVTSTTGDRVVYLDWIENQEPDLDGYRVYVSREPHGPYDLLGFTEDADFVHDDLDNGDTYYYGVTAIDYAGNESDLNNRIIYDTPRPEGFGLQLEEADGDYPEDSAFDFSREQRVGWDDERADVYFDWIDGVGYLAVPDYATDIQDAGYASFDAITWAPDEGWSPSGIVEAIVGHVYVVWTRDNNYAKVRVVDLDEDFIELDWGYQTDRGNPELRKSGATHKRPLRDFGGGAS